MCAAISSQHPELKYRGVWCSIDGLKLYLEESPNFYVQCKFYNGWTRDHYVTNVFAFAPGGTIPLSFFNVLGCVQDSLVADWGCIYQKLEHLWENYKVSCVVDSAFGKIEHNFMIKSSQDCMSFDKPSRPEKKRYIRKKSAAISMQQTAEWGMHGLQALFPCLKDQFVYEEKGEQRITSKFFQPKIIGSLLHCRFCCVTLQVK